jgi:hypothetical protein
MEEEFAAIVGRIDLIKRGGAEGLEVRRHNPVTFVKGRTVLDILGGEGVKVIYNTCHDRGSDRNGVLIMHMAMEFVFPEARYRVKKYWFAFIVRMTYEQGDALTAFHLLNIPPIFERVRGIHVELTAAGPGPETNLVRLVNAIVGGKQLFNDGAGDGPEVEPIVRANNLLWQATRREYEDDIMTMWMMPEIVLFAFQIGIDVVKEREADRQATI